MIAKERLANSNTTFEFSLSATSSIVCAREFVHGRRLDACYVLVGLKKVYSPKSMRLVRHIVKVGMTIAILFWIAVMACILGCAQPALAGSQGTVDASSSGNHAVTHSHARLMADMGDCHHSRGNPSEAASGKKPGPSGAIVVLSA